MLNTHPMHREQKLLFSKWGLDMSIYRKKRIWVTLLCIMVSSMASADYIMMCTFFGGPTAKVFNISDDGDITFSYSIDVTQGGEPLALELAPNGRWGLVGCNTTYYPLTQITTVLGIDSNRHIFVSGTVYNDNQYLVAISPDSKYGVYGYDLQTLKMNLDGSYEVIPSPYDELLATNADFSILNGNLYCHDPVRDHTPYQYFVNEYQINCDGIPASTGESVEITPSRAADLEISPDGRTCIAVGVPEYEISVLRIHEQGGLSLTQQFETSSADPRVVDFTPDSRYAIISFIWWNLNMRSFRIENHSQLTEVSAITLPYDAGEDMAVTPDGKFAITRALVSYGSLFYVVRIHDDGTLEHLPDKDYVCSGHVSDMAFVPPRITAAEGVWNMYE